MLMQFILQSQTWSNLMDRLDVLGRGAGQTALDVALAMALMLAGWGVAVLLGNLVRGALRALRFDDAVRRLSGSHATSAHDPSALAGRAAYWVVLASAAMLAFETLGFTISASVADRLGDVVPRIVTSAILFAVGALVAVLLGGITRRFLESADIRAARLQGQVVSAVLTGVAALLALEQLGFAAQFVMAIGVVAVAAAGLGLALAFGMGCRDLARDFLVEYLRALDDEGPKRPG